MPTVIDAIDTTGEVLSEEKPTPSTGIRNEDIPPYTVARAVAWMRRPENADRIQQFADTAGEIQKSVVQHIDREVTKVGRLMVDIAMNEDVETDFINSFLKSITGIGDD